jgi:hypothetical protein
VKSVPLRYLVPGALRPSNDELWWLKNLFKLSAGVEKNNKCCHIIHGTKML